MYKLDVSREVKIALEKYKELLFKWNSKINLVSINKEDDFWLRHIVDSMQLLNFIENKDIHLIDVGSGAGLPGIILSICGIKKVTLIESNTKKCSFLLHASKISTNKIDVVNDRVEDIFLDCDLLTARAFASIDKIFSLTKNIIVRDRYLLLKGEDYLSDIEKVKKNWKFDSKIHNSISFDKGKVLEIDGKNICCN